jgi:RND family efflux transporter MFP subunit
MNNSNVLKSKKVRNWVLILIVVLIVVFVALRFSPARAGNTPVEVTGTVVSLNVAETVEASGSLEAQPFASLTWNTSGVVEEVYVKAGDQVKAGDVLMKLKTNSVSSSIISAQADLVTAQQDLEDLLVNSDADLAQAVIDLRDAQQAYQRAVNYLEFLERSKTTRQTQAKTFIEDVNRGGKKYVFKTKTFKGPASEDWIIEAENDLALKKAQLEDAQRAYDRLKDGANAQDITAAQARIDAAQATVDSMSVIAPFDGQVLYVESQPGDVVTTEVVALNMANLDHLYIETRVDETEIANVTVGDPITATLDAVEGIELTGQVVAIDPLGEVESDSVQYAVQINVAKVTEDVFLPLGSTATVIIEVEPAKASLAVPITAVQNDDQGEYVSVVQSNGSTKRVDVKTSTIVDDLVVVTGDLKEGDSLMTGQSNDLQGPGGGLFGGGN